MEGGGVGGCEGEARGDARHNSSEPVAVVGISVRVYPPRPSRMVARINNEAKRQIRDNFRSPPVLRGLRDRGRGKKREGERAYEISLINRTRT